ncbi:hypothetical protein HII28_06030 [Planctomonas sp. JC2975]|uniref:hypothetical protein n=1 Tax=Planctomonas sp. JC2975 TaxID=2729626 RepID=UPI00147345C2|nr:hypothetical protein [Planctomonas sp. JC2975]NNC11437.1 hypothetical protein [Planctomonas sp. JC2975]
MTMISAADAATIPLSDDAAVLERVRSLIGRALGRRMWFLFVDAADLQLPMVMPIDDYPPEPGDEAPIVAEVVSDVMRARGASGVVVVWERPLGEEANAADRAWASALAVAFARADLALRGQLISHRSGVRWLAPDDYL